MGGNDEHSSRAMRARAAWIALSGRRFASRITLTRNYLLMTAGQLEAADARLPACWAGLLAS